MSSAIPNRSHVLLTLGVLFTIGGVTRFLPEGIAFAEQLPQGGQQAATAAASTLSETPSATRPVPPVESGPEQICFTPQTASLVQEDQWLFEAEKEELKAQKIALQTWENQLQQQTAELTALQETLEARWQEMQNGSDRDVQHLAQMYGVMKPDQAAQIFNQMDAGFAAGFLRLMQSDQAGLILASMEPQKAYVVSVKLASMNDDVRAAAPPIAN